MKIVGGSYGVNGSAYISRDQCLVVEGSARKVYPKGSATSASARSDKNNKFGCMGFAIGAVLLSIMLGAFLNLLGVVIGIAVAAAGSFYTLKNDFVDIEFNDGKKISLECSPNGVKKLINWAN